MDVDLEKANKNLEKYIEYVNAQVNYTKEEMKADLLERGLSEDDATYVMSFYRSHVKQRMFCSPFSFKGRIRRLEFGLSYILYLLLIFCISVLSDGAPVFVLLAIPVVWFCLAQLCKRFHDRNQSGMRIVTLIFPVYNLYVLFTLFFADGDAYENDYGPDPKGRNMFE